MRRHRRHRSSRLPTDSWEGWPERSCPISLEGTSPGRTCTQCPSADRILNTRRSEEEWRLFVGDKYTRGFINSTTPEQRAAIVDYLARALPRG